MGLDVHVATDKDNELRTPEYYSNPVYFKTHSLSRTFCHLLSRRDIIETESELDQLARLCNVDVTPLYEMMDYPDDEYLELELSHAKTGEERADVLQRADASRSKLIGNLEKVSRAVDGLINRLNHISDLPSLLADTDYDTLDNNEYFSDFPLDKGDGDIGNNFGQDLRNFKRFLEYARSYGVTSVYFRFG